MPKITKGHNIVKSFRYSPYFLSDNLELSISPYIKGSKLIGF